LSDVHAFFIRCYFVSRKLDAADWLGGILCLEILALYDCIESVQDDGESWIRKHSLSDVDAARYSPFSIPNYCSGGRVPNLLEVD
jgi:hypothetical protein